MIILARDVTDPAQAAAPLLKFKAFVTNPDGSTAVQMEDGSFAFQEPMQYGKFGTDPSPIGAYQECKVNGQLVSFWTREQDPPFVYSWAELPR